MNYVKEYLRLEKAAVDAEGQVETWREAAEAARWDQAKVAYDAITEGGYTQVGFAAEVGVGATTIARRVRIWAERGNHTHACWSDMWAWSVGKTQAAETNRKVEQHAVSAVRKADAEDYRLVKAIAENDALFHAAKLERAGRDMSPAGRKAAEAHGHAAARPARTAQAAFGASAVVMDLNSATDELAELIEADELNGNHMRSIRAAYDRFSEKLAVAEAQMELRR